MKIAIRALVLGMLVTGFAATQALKSAPASSTTTTVVASASAMPVPTCKSGPCSMDKF